MNRRRFLTVSATATTLVLAGCGSPGGDDDGGGGGYNRDEPTPPGPE